MKLRESRHLTQAERDAIVRDYVREFQGDHADTCDRVARAHGVTDACVRLLVHGGDKQAEPFKPRESA